MAAHEGGAATPPDNSQATLSFCRYYWCMSRFRLVAAVFVAAAGLTGSAHATTAPSSPTKGVVIVTTNLAYQNAAASGTGIVLTKSGEVLTNNHVIRGATTITVIVPASGRRYSASVLGYDISDDIALIKLDGGSGLAVATRGNSATLKLGAATTAVGNANGGGRLVITKGRVTGLNRSITVSDEQGGTSRLSGLIQTSARLVPGDSGGPLLDAAGRVIGVDSAGSANYAFTTSDGFAIPINKAVTLVKQMEAGKASALVHIGKTAFIGLTGSDVDGGGGVAIGSVVDGLPAATAGLAKNDVITALDSTPVTSLADLRTALFAHHPGDVVTISFTDVIGNKTSAQITLADGPPQ
jgi:S1-C subfamily serine protease